jgi:hypothetical protein
MYATRVAPRSPAITRQLVTRSRTRKLLFLGSAGPRWCASTRLVMWPNRSIERESCCLSGCLELPLASSGCLAATLCTDPANGCFFRCPYGGESAEAISAWPETCRGGWRLIATRDGPTLRRSRFAVNGECYLVASLYLGTTPTRCSTSRNRESERSGSHLGSTPSHDSQYECSS